ncbi:YbhB/YbcL family Raf kinase inhibitor-like protein [Methylobacterium symbioticum]|uniref:Lipoprotein LppC n=1 Tax=Methylobacterium symbioticum TaxID=2584084 RepID=A0A509EK92_9HYPH|nr:YbhB/YbcL family Raf kinase inhibitor-like protein [Methylobacterium symbioticum]VUD74024.1 Putative lipoprotein LppC [Methylobacterium symbioticum]
MLEKLPHAVGEALSGFRAGLETIAYRSAFAGTAEGIALTSPAFADGAPMPARFTADGAGVAPPLAWAGLPVGTAGLALLVEDADAPTPQPLVHLIAPDIDPAPGAVAEGALSGGELGRNSVLQTGWLPPDPPSGHGTHRYCFQLYALSAALAVPGGLGRSGLIEAMRGRVLAKGLLIGTYARP